MQKKIIILREFKQILRKKQQICYKICCVKSRKISKILRNTPSTFFYLKKAEIKKSCIFKKP